MTENLTESDALLVKRQPWYAARDGDVWEVTGKGRGFPGIHAPEGTPVLDTAFVRSLMYVSEEGGDGPVFLPFGVSDGYVWLAVPADIVRARRMILVDATTGETQDPDDQLELDTLVTQRCGL